MTPGSAPRWPRRLLALGLLVLVLGCLAALVAVPVLERYQHYRQAIEEQEFRLQRLRSVAAGRADLEAQIQRLRTEGRANEFYLQRQPLALASAELQQRVSRIVANYGGQLRRTQVLPEREQEQEGFDRVAIRVELEGNIEALRGVLYEIESGVPLLMVDNVRIQPRLRRLRRVPGLQSLGELSISFELFGYMRAADA